MLTGRKGGRWFSALGISQKYPPRLVINAAFKSNPALKIALKKSNLKCRLKIFPEENG